MSCSASCNVRSGRCRYGLIRGLKGPSDLFSAIEISFRGSSLPSRSARRSQFNTAHGRKLSWSSMKPGPRRRLTRRSCWLRQICPRPLARLDAGREWTEIDNRNTPEGVATIRTAMRDDVVASGSGLSCAVVPSPKELDRWIDIVATNGARAPDSHVRCLLFRSMIREPQRAILIAATALHYPLE